MRRIAGMALALSMLAACDSGEKIAAAPEPQEVTIAAVGHYCGMNLIEHAGPKGQIFINGSDQPVWFTAIKQVFAYTLLPEEPKGIRAIYVHDMGKARNWDQPEAGTWMDARHAYYVIESQFIGGMGAEDALPFSDEALARQFAEKYHGRVVGFADMPEDYILHHDDAAQVPPSAPGPKPLSGEPSQ
nr:nitrous oxide reductase accessory protein NosL [Pollutimonas bauzanensis]